MEFVRTLKALADPLRLRILAAVAEEELTVGEVQDVVESVQSSVSRNLAILRDAGLVHIREEGKQTFYTLSQERVAVCCGQIMLKFAPEEKATEAVIKVVNQ